MKPRTPHVGAPERTRTSDTRFRKPLLYPLSYGGAMRMPNAMDPVCSTLRVEYPA